MMNTDNVMEVQAADYEYIFGERLKNITASIQDKITDITNYQKLKVSDICSNEEIEIQYFVTEYKGKKLISTYSSKRASKDKAEREQKIAKAQAYLENPYTLGKKAKRFYLKKQGKDQYSLDLEKIKKSEQFDGFMTIATNNKELSVAQVLEAYKQLYKIEQSFRSFKTFLETRPMYHWTEKRILGHLALCYISFTVLNYLQLQLKKQGTPQSENEIRKNLIKMQMSLITQNEQQYYLRSKTEEGSKQIMKAMSIREIPDLIPQQSINQYM